VAAAIVFLVGVARRHGRQGTSPATSTPTLVTTPYAEPTGPMVESPPLAPTQQGSPVDSANPATAATGSAPVTVTPLTPPTAIPGTTPDATARPTATATTAPHAHKGNGGAPPKNDDCKPPYTIDSEGNKHYKPNCL
jgi:serine/threonine-protein kinase